MSFLALVFFIYPLWGFVFLFSLCCMAVLSFFGLQMLIILLSSLVPLGGLGSPLVFFYIPPIFLFFIYLRNSSLSSLPTPTLLNIFSSTFIHFKERSFFKAKYIRYFFVC